MPESTSREVRLEFWVRSLAPQGVRDRLAALVGRLDALDGDGTIDDYSVEVVGRELPARRRDAVTTVGRTLLDRIADFHEWAAVNDHSLGSLFEPTPVRSSITGETNSRIVLPMFTLAEYEDGALRFVTPCDGPSTEWTVEDRLAHLAAVGAETDPVEPIAESRSERPAPSLASHR